MEDRMSPINTSITLSPETVSNLSFNEDIMFPSFNSFIISGVNWIEDNADKQSLKISFSERMPSLVTNYKVEEIFI